MWTNEITYWAWRETAEQAKKRIAKKIPIPPMPTQKKLDYATVNKKPSAGLEMQLCIGVWDDDVYTPINRNILEFHLKQYHCTADSQWSQCKNSKNCTEKLCLEK